MVNEVSRMDEPRITVERVYNPLKVGSRLLALNTF